MQVEFHQLDRRLEHLRVHSPRQQRRLLASMAATSQQTPIVVVAAADDPNRYVVIDGYKRIAALEQLHRDTVAAVLWPMSEAEALVLERSLRMGDKPTALEQGWLLSELEQRFGYGLDELAERFDRSVSWVSRRLALVDLLPKVIQQQVREGKITAHVAMKYLVPVARVNLDDCEQMAAGFARHRCTTRQAGQIYAAWRVGPPAIRQRVLAEPELFLKAQQVTARAPDGPAAELLRDLEIVAAMVGRVSKRLAAATAEMDPKQYEEARVSIDRARRGLSDLAGRMDKETAHADQSTTPNNPGAQCAGREQGRDRPPVRNFAPLCTQSAQRGLGGSSGASSAGEGLSLPATDPGALGLVQGQSRAGP